MSYNWISIIGDYNIKGNNIIFKGGTSLTEDGREVREVGNFICDQYFSSGEISGKIKFNDYKEFSACGFILHYEPNSQTFTMVDIGFRSFCGIRTWIQSKWVHHAELGDTSQIVSKKQYSFRVSVEGSKVSAFIDNIEILRHNLPFVLPVGQCGVWCIGESDITVESFKVKANKPKVFVIMQYTEPYNELYSEVIMPICDEKGLDIVRADETYGPGIIISDIENLIAEASIIIADITPVNANVYYELGYAHALNKSTILIAEKPTQLPFDVSPYRVLFYENTIAGKNRIKEGLRKHIEAIIGNG